MKKISLYLIVILSIFTCVRCDEELFPDENAMQLTGTWECDESSSLFKSTMDIYHVYISPHPTDSLKFIISNFYDLGSGVSAIANRSGSSLILPSQTLSGNFIIEGNGNIGSNNKSIHWIYTVDDGSGSLDEVTALYTFKY